MINLFFYFLNFKLFYVQLNCQDTNGEKIITTLSDQSGFSDLAMANASYIEHFDYRNQIDVTLKLNDVTQVSDHQNS